MHLALLADPLLAWRDDRTLQIGWGTHSVVVADAPAALPTWVRSLRADLPAGQALARAAEFGVPPEVASRVLADLREAGLLAGPQRVRVAVASRALVGQALTEALTAAGVEVARTADVVVYPQGQVPSLVAAPTAGRLLPVWFAAQAVHVGPVIDDTRGPCPRCVDLTWSQADPVWPRLVAQAGTVGSWCRPSQITQAAALIALLAPAPQAVGLEMIADPAHPGPRWRVWSPHPECACRT
jgi:hypothetical protein